MKKEYAPAAGLAFQIPQVIRAGTTIKPNNSHFSRRFI
jgi:hypothetical protein